MWIGLMNKTNIYSETEATINQMISIMQYVPVSQNGNTHNPINVVES